MYRVTAEFFEGGGRIICFELQKRINSKCNNEELPINGRSKLLYLFIRRVMKQTVLIIGACPFFQPHTKFYTTSSCEG
jgi:hypothetical protein